MSQQEAAYLAAMPFTVRVPSLNIIITHAGLVPGVSIKRQRLQDLYRVSVFLQRMGAVFSSFQLQLQSWFMCCPICCCGMMNSSLALLVCAHFAALHGTLEVLHSKALTV